MDAKQEHLTKNDAGRQNVFIWRLVTIVSSAEHRADVSSHSLFISRLVIVTF